MERILLPEFDGYQILQQHGIPLPPYFYVKTHEDALKAAETLGYPVVIKIVSPQIIHKSDAGGVVAQPTCPEALESAADGYIWMIK
jgi:acyl-CoA synthetase (NDP forming)